MAFLDLQAMKRPGGHGGGGSTLTVVVCASRTPSNLSVAICHT